MGIREMAVELLVNNWVSLFVTFSVAFAVARLLVLFARHFPILCGQSANVSAVQSAHSKPTPRVGGVAIFTALVLTVFYVPETIAVSYPSFLVAAGLLFFVGLAEDLGFGISPRWRLLAAVGASLAAVVMLGIWLPRLNIPYVDVAMGYWIIGVPVTLFITAGVANGFNLIDGVNGLSGYTGIVAALALAAISVQAGNDVMALVSLFLACAVAGFVLVNYPRGMIFLGDAGAYTLGFVLAWFGIALLNAALSVSAWSILLTVYWPLCDTLLAMYRRSRSKRDAMAPDRLHAHQLVMRSLEILVLGRGRRNLANPLTTLVLAPFVAAPPLAGVLLWNNPLLAFGFAVVFLGLFWGTYFFAADMARVYRRRSDPRISVVREGPTFAGPAKPVAVFKVAPEQSMAAPRRVPREELTSGSQL
ncbi:hypothetical protein B9057_15160 (plasmid) [Aestuarium zhoushanense]|nr:hypothetical protein B9057_15160 [Aestuarium zhoushanense]